MYSRTLALKRKFNVKVLLAVGGWNFGSGLFSDMVKDDVTRRNFVQDATRFLRNREFDGLDLDWVTQQDIVNLLLRFILVRNCRNTQGVVKAADLKTNNASHFWSK